MTVQCIRCSNFSLQAADPRLASFGLGVCAIHSRGPWHTHSAKFQRHCAEFEAAPAATVAKRVRLLDDDAQQPLLT